MITGLALLTGNLTLLVAEFWLYWSQPVLAVFLMFMTSVTAGLLAATLWVEGLPVSVRWATNEPVMIRDNYACSRCGRRAHTVNHRIRGNRKDRRPSNLHAVCGDGTTGDHGHITTHPADAMRWGWQVRRGGDTTAERIWMAAGVLGAGWYLLDDDGGLTLAEPAQPGEGPLF